MDMKKWIKNNTECRRS